jgi:hypothetical protein
MTYTSALASDQDRKIEQIKTDAAADAEAVRLQRQVAY